MGATAAAAAAAAAAEAPGAKANTWCYGIWGRLYLVPGTRFAQTKSSDWETTVPTNTVQ